MSEARDTQITNLSDDELDQVSGGATNEEIADASAANTAAVESATANRSV